MINKLKAIFFYLFIFIIFSFLSYIFILLDKFFAQIYFLDLLIIEEIVTFFKWFYYLKCFLLVKSCIALIAKVNIFKTILLKQMLLK